jgi:hypothetical protein
MCRVVVLLRLPRIGNGRAHMDNLSSFRVPTVWSAEMEAVLPLRAPAFSPAPFEAFSYFRLPAVMMV